MSQIVYLNSIDETTKKKIQEDLTVQLNIDKKYVYAAPQFIYTFNVIDGKAYLPFAYTHKNKKLLGVNVPGLEQYTTRDIKFAGKLRENQISIKNDALAYLNKYNSAIISAYPGCGKCLGYDTPIRMYNGTIKMVQNITSGDMLMGDDSTPRTVYSTVCGREQMYRVHQEYKQSFTANKSHILSLVVCPSPPIICVDNQFECLVFDTTRCKYIYKSFNSKRAAQQSIYIDISIKKYNSLKPDCQFTLKGYSSIVEFKKMNQFCDPYIIGAILGGCCDFVLPQYHSFTEACIKLHDRFKLTGKLPIEYTQNTFASRYKLLAGFIDMCGTVIKSEFIHCQTQHKPSICIVMDICETLGIYCIQTKIGVQLYGDFSKIETGFVLPSTTTNYTQSTIKLECIGEGNYYGFTLSDNCRFLLKDCTVTHNTCISLYLSAIIKRKTLILWNKTILVPQWIKSITSFCPGTTSLEITSKTDMSKQPDFDFYLVNASTVPKLTPNDFKDIGFVICDECHMIMAKRLSEAMNFLTPCYLLGLSATPYRHDGLHKLIELYFGTNQVYRKLNQKHICYQINTKFKPVVKFTEQGRLNWGSVLESQAWHKPRNDMIVSIVEKFHDRIFLILCKRVDQAKILVKLLQDMGQSVTSLYGSTKLFDKKSRILVGTTGKAGVGFDHARLDALILAGDIKQYFIQYLGRILRNPNPEKIPIVFDIVDNNFVLKKHFKTRQEIYTSHNGTILKFEKSFPQLKQYMC